MKEQSLSNELNIYKLSHTTSTMNNTIIEKCDQSIQVYSPEEKRGVAVVVMESGGVVNSVSSNNSIHTIPLHERYI